jgi:hypothetical protein
LASVPAISRASVSTSSDKARSEQTGRLNPCPLLRTRLDRNKRVGSTRGETRFAPRERGPGRFAGRCWLAHSQFDLSN